MTAIATVESPDDVFPELDHRYAREVEGLFVDWQPAAVAAPRLLVVNASLAHDLGLDPEALAAPAGVAVLAGNRTPVGARPVAMAYAGHQFGGFSPRLGDGRALLLGEIVTAAGHRDIHLKGSGRTPFARGGDGKAAVGPMLREYVIAEAMHALSIPTTRALAVVATGERIMRDGSLPGAVLTRVASSHLRVGTFEFAARTGDPAAMDRLINHAIARHYPAAANAANPALSLLESVIEAQASLVAQWMLVGFIHGVMNTDNMTISGESIDFGPCAFMDRYDPSTVYSSIDHGGRYAYGNQPHIAQWNLARLAETLLPRIDTDSDRAVAIATEALHRFPDRFDHHWDSGMRAKLGFTTSAGGDRAIFDSWLALLGAKQSDYTSAFRALAHALRDDAEPLRALLGNDDDVTAWLETWRTRLAMQAAPTAEVAAAMDRVNPVHIPRNHHVERVLEAATLGDLAPFNELLNVVLNPFDEVAEWASFAEPAPESFSRYHQTFCGT